MHNFIFIRVKMLFLVKELQNLVQTDHIKNKTLWQINSYRCTLLHTKYEDDHRTLLPPPFAWCSRRHAHKYKECLRWLCSHHVYLRMKMYTFLKLTCFCPKPIESVNERQKSNKYVVLHVFVYASYPYKNIIN